MEYNKVRNEVVRTLVNEIDENKGAAVGAMLMDIENTLKENREDFLVFNEEHEGVIAISFLNNTIKFVDGEGNLINAHDYTGEDYDFILEMWCAFREDC